MVQKGTKMILQYWTVDGKQYPVLRTIALKVFSMAASRVASKQNFSMNRSNIQNCKILIKEENVQKLLFMKSNTLKLKKEI
jgi:hypothetical protein